MRQSNRSPAPAAERPDKARRHDLASIQYLRAIAALLVVFFHAINHFPGVPSPPVPRVVGLSGVDVFFVISGFVMTITTAGNPYTIGQFLTRRLIRIVPLYWFFTFVTLVLVLAVPSGFRRSMVTASHLVQSLLFIPHLNPGEPGALTPLVKLGWTLNFEMFFYVLFALLMGVSPVRRSVLVTLEFAAVYAFATQMHGTWPPLRLWGNLILFEFTLGIIVGHLYLSGALRRLPTGVSIALVAVSVGGLVAGATVEVHRLLTFGVPATVLVAAMVGLEDRGVLPTIRVARFLGDAAYSVYLSHLFVIVVLRAGWAASGLPHTGVVATLGFVLLCLTGAGTVGGACYLLLERPVLRCMQARFLGARPRPPS